MVGGTPKPFACTSEGCTMTFTNEDHLNVHQRKHEMVLNLGLKSSSIVADQTPTPTRFLRNCEELGLFQDLQNVNPFEETFKKAAEMVKTGSLPVPDLPEDDTLHTPHILPHIMEENIFSQTFKKDKIELNLTVEHMNSDKDKDTVITLNSSEHILNINTNKTPTILINDKPALIDEKKPKFVVREKKFSSSKIVKNIKPITAKEKLQQILQTKTKTEQKSVIFVPMIQTLSSELPILPKSQNTITEIVPVIPTTDISILPKQNTILKHMKTKQPIVQIQSITDEIDKRKLDLLERNRAAATRCRARKKEWTKSLENKYNIVCKENDKLQKENTSLRNDIQQLKALLLAHKDCPVTKAMNMGQNIAIGPPIVSIQVPSINKKQIKGQNTNQEMKNVAKTSVIVLNDSVIS